MRCYLAGNFPMMVYPALERKMKDELQERGYDYNRLISAWYENGARTVISVCKETKETAGSTERIPGRDDKKTLKGFQNG